MKASIQIIQSDTFEPDLIQKELQCVSALPLVTN